MVAIHYNASLIAPMISQQTYTTCFDMIIDHKDSSGLCFYLIKTISHHVRIDTKNRIVAP